MRDTYTTATKISSIQNSAQSQMTFGAKQASAGQNQASMASMRSIKPYTGRRKREERKNGPMPEMELVSDINMFN